MRFVGRPRLSWWRIWPIEAATSMSPGSPSRPPKVDSGRWARLGASIRSTLFCRPAFGGLAVGVMFWWFSLVPSLLPRDWIVQAAVSAVCVLAGYGVGSAFGWLVRVGLGRVGRRPDARFRRGSSSALAVVAVLVLVAGIVTWPRWQNTQRALVGMTDVTTLDALASILAAAVFVVVVGAGCRFVWWQARGLDRWFDRRLSHSVALIVTVVIVTLAGQIVMREVVWNGFVSWANNVYSTADRGRGVAEPSTPNVSGSTGSLVRWETLGLQGRTFVAGVTTAQTLHGFHGADAAVMDPIRVYVGTRSAKSLEDEAALAVRELIRTGAFDRAVLLVATATGTGWIDPDASTAIEQLYSGDTAIVSMQYSYLPSWITFLIDHTDSAPAGSILFNAVYQEWARRPVTARPKLVVFGESLGSHGAEAAFAGFDSYTSIANLVARTDGALFAGPVASNPIWSKIVRERVAGSPSWRPVFNDGRTVRVFIGTDDLTRIDPTWTKPRVAYLVYPSDPVPVFRANALWSRPGWTKPPLAYDVPGSVGWFPIVTLVQSVGDLASAFDVPAGHGHNYDIDFVGAWANVLAPDGWTDADTVRLEHFLAH